MAQWLSTAGSIESRLCVLVEANVCSNTVLLNMRFPSGSFIHWPFLMSLRAQKSKSHTLVQHPGQQPFSRKIISVSESHSAEQFYFFPSPTIHSCLSFSTHTCPANPDDLLRTGPDNRCNRITPLLTM